MEDFFLLLVSTKLENRCQQHSSLFFLPFFPSLCPFSGFNRNLKQTGDSLGNVLVEIICFSRVLMVFFSLLRAEHSLCFKAVTPRLPCLIPQGNGSQGVPQGNGSQEFSFYSVWDAIPGLQNKAVGMGGGFSPALFQSSGKVSDCELIFPGDFELLGSLFHAVKIGKCSHREGILLILPSGNSP